MALVNGDWRFPAWAKPPGLSAFVAALGRSMGIEVRIEEERGDTLLRVPLLRESLFDWRAGPGRVQLHGFAPPHPFLWEHVDAVLSGQGGQVAEDPTAWRPAPRHQGLRRPWPALPWRDRWLLRVPTVAMARPLDRFLDRGG